MKKAKVLLIGGQGFVGSLFAEKFSSLFDIASTYTHRSTSQLSDSSIACDITSRDILARVIDEIKPNYILHTAAITHIDLCQSDKKNGKNGQVWKVNVLGTRNIAVESNKNNIPLIYLSTECVFDGKKEYYNEMDEPNPINWYGETKYRGEIEALDAHKDVTILRAVLAYGHKNKFAHDIARILYTKISQNQPLNVVDDQRINLTFIDDLIETIKNRILNFQSGIFHFGGEDVFTPFLFAKKIAADFILSDDKIMPVSLKRYFGEHAKYRLKNAVLKSQNGMDMKYMTSTQRQKELKDRLSP
jgi:dTDP-4-dehydrorhamnose reductase